MTNKGKAYVPQGRRRVVDWDLEAIRIGQHVKVVFKPTEGGSPVPMFTRA